MADDVLEGNHFRKDPPDREPQSSFRPHVDVNTSEAPNPDIKITGSANTKREELDKRYNIRQDAKKFFVVGRVFATLWPEQPIVASQAGSLVAAASSAAEMTRFGERVYTHIRRMAVVQGMDGHCTCIPIGTYTNTNTNPKNIPVASEVRVLQTPHTSKLIPDSLVSRRVADEPLHDHD
jgi:hypothetical protein